MFRFHKSARLSWAKRAVTGLLACALSASILAAVPQHVHAVDTSDPYIRAGLYYGTTAKATCNLANADQIGSGYTF